MKSLKTQLLHDLRDLPFDRQAIAQMHDHLSVLAEQKKELPASQREALDHEYDVVLARLISTTNHVSSLELPLYQLSPEEQLVLERIVINPYKGSVFDLCSSLNCETAKVYRLRASGLHKLGRLKYGAEWRD